ncbi:hypothetical protein RCL_jg4283.t1 [Rhizophagus clarus]|uniref:Uncharacterized protein n=1 Tax=Rhizophagus clarus TaxID=94130 RepID=A0A8H3KTR1_9GLOM|nr:hypothetical protein RCL_jg4283.t1 [Rhizophagus clarus]
MLTFISDDPISYDRTNLKKIHSEGTDVIEVLELVLFLVTNIYCRSSQSFRNANACSVRYIFIILLHLII